MSDNGKVDQLRKAANVLAKFLADVARQQKQINQIAADQREIAERIAKLEQPGR